MLPGCIIKWYEALEADHMRVGTASVTDNRYLPLLVEKVFWFPFAYPLPSNQVEGVARCPIQLCLTRGVTQFIRRDGGGAFVSRCVQHLCKLLRADIQ